MPQSNFTIPYYLSACVGNVFNCKYNTELRASSMEEIKVAVAYDHVNIKFKGNYRSVDNFEYAEVVTFDNDNDHSDNPEDWIDIAEAKELFHSLDYVLTTSRSNMKQKSTSSPRPRYHITFRVDTIKDSKLFSVFMRKVQTIFPFFDENALDAGRFFYGNPDAEIVIHNGGKSMTEFVADWGSEQAFAELDEVIPDGRCNSTLSLIAGKTIKRLGDTGDAYKMFLQCADKCNPPLKDSEINHIWRSAQKFYKKVKMQPEYISPEEYNISKEPRWETPIPFEEFSLPPFPVEALPPAVRNYVLAVAESTQTPMDMSASAALAIMALCEQGKYRIRGKADWLEPLNIFVVIVAEPSERKSAIISLMTKPVNEFEAEQNRKNAAALESSRMNKRILERRQRVLEDKAAKGKLEDGELESLAQEVSDYKEKTPLRLYVDDVTTEKLTSVLAEGNGKAAIVSAEGGIFDMLSGIYTKNVNIDVMLKGHSGDCIRVDRIGRNSESIMNPTLTVLLTVQPNVLAGMMQNGTFRGRGLTARFLYCMPTSIVGRRKYRTEPIPSDIAREYLLLIRNLLEDEQQSEPEIITLSPEADCLLESFAADLEPKLKQEYADIADWAGKLVGAILRVAGILCRASVYYSHDFLDIPDSLIVDEGTMQNAILIGLYFLDHSKAAFSLMGADILVKQCQYVLSAVKKNSLSEFNRRDIMRLCRNFKTVDEVQPVLDHLSEYGYIAPKGGENYSGKGRPTAQTYLVNPCIYEKVS